MSEQDNGTLRDLQRAIMEVNEEQRKYLLAFTEGLAAAARVAKELTARGA